MKTNSRATVSTLLLTLLIAAMLSPMTALAACTVNGPIVRVTQYDDNYSSVGCYLYMRPNAVSTFYYYARTDDDNTCSNAVTALTSNVDIILNGNAASCPTSGTGRNMGLVNYMIINP